MATEILIVGDFFPTVAKSLSEDFTVHQLATISDFHALDDEFLKQISGFASFGWAPAETIDRMPNLKMISSFGVGYDGVAAEYAAQKGIVVGHTPDVLNDEVANTAIALMLATDRRIVAYDKYVRAGRWLTEGHAPLTRGISGKTVGILGLGRIGEAIAEKLSVFGCTVVYHSRSQKTHVSYKYFADLEDMARASDLLVVITPGGPETDKLVSKDVIEALGPTGTLINVARGTVVDEAAMVEALKDGRLGAAGLDVFEDEPKVPEALFELDNVVLLPHVGSATIETRQAMADRVVDNMRGFFKDGKPVSPVPESAALLD